MTDRGTLSSEERKLWREALQAAATPARWPQFPALSCDGEWTDWSASPDLPSNKPSSVEQPPLIRSIPGDAQETKSYCGLQPTSLPAGCIRLLKLENAHLDVRSNVMCGFELVDVPLESAPEYDAISYSWGDMRLCTGISFNGADTNKSIFRITEDLATCLYSIVQSKELATPSYAWVDQICVNQEDINERNAQVKIMVDIYRRASQVIVWLGQETDTVGWKQEFSELLDVPTSYLAYDVGTLSHLILEASKFARSWFNRMWVFQEVVVAKKISVLLGEEVSSWDEEDEKLRDILRRIGSDSANYVIFGTVNRILVPSVNYSKLQVANKGYINIATFLPNLSATQSCSEPKDMIFGLLSCAGNTIPSNFVDYRKTVHDVFRDATRLMTETYKSLNIINHIHKDHASRGWGNSPTWSPHWGNHDVNMVQFTGGDRGRFSASCNRTHKPMAPIHPDKLQVQGKLVDTVSVIIPGTPMLCSSLFWTLSREISIRQLCDEVWRHSTHMEMVPAELDISEDMPFDVMREVVDTLFYHEDASKPPFEIDNLSLEETYEALVEDELGDVFKNEDNENRRSTITAQSWCLNQSMAILQSGRLALVLEDVVQVGDQVAILHGLPVPCIIRQDEGHDEWTFHGDTFVKSLMQGQGVTWEEDETDTITLV